MNCAREIRTRRMDPVDQSRVCGEKVKQRSGEARDCGFARFLMATADRVDVRGWMFALDAVGHTASARFMSVR